MSDIKPRVSGAGHVPISSTRFNICANFSDNCNGSACNSATLHPSAPGALVLFIFLQAFLSFSPSSSSPEEVSNCCLVGRVPSSRILNIGIQACSMSACTCQALACRPTESSKCGAAELSWRPQVSRFTGTGSSSLALGCAAAVFQCQVFLFARYCRESQGSSRCLRSPPVFFFKKKKTGAAGLQTPSPFSLNGAAGSQTS